MGFLCFVYLAKRPDKFNWRERRFYDSEYAGVCDLRNTQCLLRIPCTATGARRFFVLDVRICRAMFRYACDIRQPRASSECQVQGGDCRLQRYGASTVWWLHFRHLASKHLGDRLIQSEVRYPQDLTASSVMRPVCFHTSPGNRQFLRDARHSSQEQIYADVPHRSERNWFVSKLRVGYTSTEGG